MNFSFSVISSLVKRVFGFRSKSSDITNMDLPEPEPFFGLNRRLMLRQRRMRRLRARRRRMLRQQGIPGIRMRLPRIRGIRMRLPRIRGIRMRQPRIRGIRMRQPRIRGIRIRQPRIRGIRVRQPRIRGIRVRQPRMRRRIRGIRGRQPRVRRIRQRAPRVRRIRRRPPRWEPDAPDLEPGPSQSRRFEQWRSLLRREPQGPTSGVSHCTLNARMTWPNASPPLATNSNIYAYDGWLGWEQMPPTAIHSRSTNLQINNQNASAQRATDVEPSHSHENNETSGAADPEASRSGADNEQEVYLAPGTSRSEEIHEHTAQPLRPGTSTSGENSEPPGFSAVGSDWGRNDNHNPDDEIPGPSQMAPGYLGRNELRRSEPPRPVERDCPICLDKLSSARIQFLGCAHGFHAHCLNKWLLVSLLANKRERVCPVCRVLVD